MESSLCAASDRMQQPPDLVRRVIRDEWVTTLDDLVERRLMLLYQQSLSRQQLTGLADLLVEARRLAPNERDSAVAATTERLRTHFGKNVAS
jgi:glycerol-3-phosphate dehydrogenase